MLQELIKTLMRGGYHLKCVDGAVCDACSYSALLSTVLDGVDKDKIRKTTGCFIGDCNTFNDVVIRWFNEGMLPDNDYKEVLKKYVANDYVAALCEMLNRFGNLKDYKPMLIEFSGLSIEDVRAYVEFVPDDVLKSIVDRYLFNPDLTSDNPSLLFHNDTVCGWFDFCRRQGWLKFEPYVYTKDDNPALVLNYDCLIRFDGECWGIYKSEASNSYVFKGAKFDRGIWDIEYPKFTNALFCATFINVACRLRAFNRLLKERYSLVHEFLQMVRNRWDIGDEECCLAGIFQNHMYAAYDVIPMHYRLVKDKCSEYARLRIDDAWSGAFEVDGGIKPQTVYYDFSGLFENNMVPNSIYNVLSTGEAPAVFLGAVLALSGIIFDNIGIYSTERGRILHFGCSENLKEIKSMNELSWVTKR